MKADQEGGYHGFKRLVEQATSVVFKNCNKISAFKRPAAIILWGGDEYAMSVACQIVPDEELAKFLLGYQDVICLLMEIEDVPAELIAPTETSRAHIEADHIIGHVRVISFGCGYSAVFDQCYSHVFSSLN